MLRTATRDRLIPRNPIDNGIQLPTIPHLDLGVLTAGQVAELIASAGVFWGTPIAVAAGTGLRFGELFGLARRDMTRCIGSSGCGAS